jgi:CHASE2 domain-containing sensor protein
MEVVLLWLDDLDDALFTMALGWERLRRLVLKVGLASAIALAAAELAAIATQWVPALSLLAAGSVAAWSAGSLLRACYYRESRRGITAA